MNPGEYGFYKYYKKKKLIICLILFLIITFVVGACLFLYHTTKKTAIVVAIVLVLPLAKTLIAYWLIAKFHSVDNDIHDKILNICNGDDYIVLFDTCLSSTEGIYGTPVIVIYNGNSYIYFTGGNIKKLNNAMLKSYVLDCLKRWKYDDFTTYIFNDIDEMLEAIKEGKTDAPDINATKSIESRIRVLAVD